MHYTTIELLAAVAENKIQFLKRNVLKFFILSVFGGIYVGIGVILVFSLSAPLLSNWPEVVRTLMALSFGVALTLIIFAGAELFTGNNLLVVVAWLEHRITLTDGLRIWFWSYLGNLVGSILIAWLALHSGLISGEPLANFLKSTAVVKMTAPIGQLFVRAILCNMLVCLAVWMSSRTKEDSAKLILIWWCLFAFIGSGYEHSIANMGLLSMALMIPGKVEAVSLAGFFANLIPVTIGNMIGGGVIIGAGYWFASKTGEAGEEK